VRRGLRQQGQRSPSCCGFASTLTDSEEQNISLPDYIKRMKDGQEKDLLRHRRKLHAAKNSPHLEIFPKKGSEVLLLSIGSTNGCSLI